MFKEEISTVFEGFYMIREHICNTIVTTKNDFADHLRDL